MIKNIKMKLTAIMVLAVASFAAASQGTPQAYPTQPVRVLLGFPAGAVTDALTRTVAQQLGERLNQQFVVDNRPGAATRIAMEALQKAAPDGQTIAVGNAVVTTFGMMFDGLSFDPGKEFVPISMLGRSPSFIAVRGNMPVKNFDEFKKFAKGAKLSVGHPGNGTNPHLAGAALARSLGADVVEVAFKGGTPLAVALGAGDIDFALVGLSVYPCARGPGRDPSVGSHRATPI
jgi:tripartite-type tricarboxylate transporter receptor subunit TctC